jgi:hypothetical protein
MPAQVVEDGLAEIHGMTVGRSMAVGWTTSGSLPAT